MPVRKYGAIGRGALEKLDEGDAAGAYDLAEVALPPPEENR